MGSGSPGRRVSAGLNNELDMMFSRELDDDGHLGCRRNSDDSALETQLMRLVAV